MFVACLPASAFYSIVYFTRVGTPYSHVRQLASFVYPGYCTLRYIVSPSILLSRSPAYLFLSLDGRRPDVVPLHVLERQINNNVIAVRC